MTWGHTHWHASVGEGKNPPHNPSQSSVLVVKPVSELDCRSLTFGCVRFGVILVHSAAAPPMPPPHFAFAAYALTPPSPKPSNPVGELDRGHTYAKRNPRRYVPVICRETVQKAQN